MASVMSLVARFNFKARDHVARIFAMRALLRRDHVFAFVIFSNQTAFSLCSQNENYFQRPGHFEQEQWRSFEEALSSISTQRARAFQAMVPKVLQREFATD